MILEKKMYSTSKIDVEHLMKQMGLNIRACNTTLLNNKNEDKTKVISTTISAHSWSKSYLTSININKFSEDMSYADIHAVYSLSVDEKGVTYTYGMDANKENIDLIKDIYKIEDYLKILVALSNKAFKLVTVDIRAKIHFTETMPIISDVNYSIRPSMFGFAIQDNTDELTVIEYVDKKLSEHSLNYDSRESVKDIVKVFDMLFI